VLLLKNSPYTLGIPHLDATWLVSKWEDHVTFCFGVFFRVVPQLEVVLTETDGSSRLHVPQLQPVIS